MEARLEKAKAFGGPPIEPGRWMSLQVRPVPANFMRARAGLFALSKRNLKFSAFHSIPPASMRSRKSPARAPVPQEKFHSQKKITAKEVIRPKYEL